jgi:HlyD family secretion protein
VLSLPPDGDGAAFRPAALRVLDSPPSPLRRAVLRTMLVLLLLAAFWVWLGRLDIVAVAEGRLVPRTLLKVVQPAEPGVVREILVDEGMHVVSGQTLLRLDAHLNEADLRAFTAEVSQRELAQRRIDAELGDDDFDRRIGDREDFDIERARFRANRTAYVDALAHEAAAVARIGQELQSALQVYAKIDRTLPILRTTAERYARLREDGFVSELAWLEREREHIEKEQDLHAQGYAVEALRAGLAQADRRREQVTSTYRQQLHAERAQNLAQLARARETLAKERYRAELIDLRAPQDGIIKELATRTEGSVVAPGTVLVTLVPTDDELQVDAALRNDDVGFVHPGQVVRIKLAAYPFQKYGLIEGEVVRVGADAMNAPPADRDAAATPSDLAGHYRVRIALARQSLEFAGIELPLAPGMAATAEIRLGDRGLGEYLLAPISKAWHEAARER